MELFKEKDEIPENDSPRLSDNTQDQLIEFLSTPCKEEDQRQGEQPEDDEKENEDDELRKSNSYDVFELFNEKDRDDIKKDLLQNDYFA